MYGGDRGCCGQSYQQEQTRSESLVISSSGAGPRCAPLLSCTPSEKVGASLYVYKCLICITWMKLYIYPKYIVHHGIIEVI